MSNLPEETLFHIIEQLSCKEIILKFANSLPKLTSGQLEILTNNIKSESFDKLQAVDKIKEEEGQYVPFSRYKKREANIFYTKCMYVHLQKYVGDTMKKKWCDAIIKRNQSDNENDLKAFANFTDVSFIRRKDLKGINFDFIFYIYIPDGVTRIGKYAFLSKRLDNVYFPNTLKFIGEGAFLNNRIRELELPKSLTHIGPNAFTENLLETVRIPRSVKNLAESAFDEKVKIVRERRRVKVVKKQTTKRFLTLKF